MKKKLFSLLLALLMIFSMVTTAYASDDAEKAPDVATESYTHFLVTTNSFEIIGGIAYCVASASCVPAVDRIDLSMYLQKYDGGWVTVKSWSNRTNDDDASIYGHYAIVSGYTYRLRSFYYAYIDGVCVDNTIMNYYRDYL